MAKIEPDEIIRATLAAVEEWKRRATMITSSIDCVHDIRPALRLLNDIKFFDPTKETEDGK
jgi:hypothetical protein